MKGRLEIGGLIIALGLSPFWGSSSALVIDAPTDSSSKPAQQIQNYEPSTEEAVQNIRDSFQHNGYDVPKGGNGREIARVFYSSSEPWIALLDSNIARGNIGYVQTLLEVPDPSNWRGVSNMHYRFHALRAGDHLDFPSQIEWGE